MNPAIEAMLSRRSVRRFSGEAVKPEDMELILRAAMAAPSAVNIQPWAFVVVTERSLLDALRTRLPFAKMLDKAGAAVIVCGIPRKDAEFAPKYWTADCSAATQNILLAAHALGYGAVWTAVHPEEDRIATVRAICGIPGSAVPLNVVPIGVPAEAGSAPVDKYKTENIHLDRW